MKKPISNLTEIDLINSLEKSDISYINLQSKNDTLIVCFASAEHHGWERKTSLLDLKQKYDFDLMFLRNRWGWYTESLNGIGNSFSESTKFFLKTASSYKKIIAIGGSSGGYASILYGCLCKFDEVIAIQPQTDLVYASQFCPPLQKLLKRIPDFEFLNLNNLVEKSNTKINIVSKSNEQIKDSADKHLHGLHHYHNIKNNNNVNYINGEGTPNSLGFDCLLKLF